MSLSPCARVPPLGDLLARGAVAERGWPFTVRLRAQVDEIVGVRAILVLPTARRSFISVVSDTRQPWPTPPRRWLSGMRTSVKNTSLKCLGHPTSGGSAGSRPHRGANGSIRAPMPAAQPRNALVADIAGGVTTFLAMVYVLVVNPSILSASGAGIPFSGALTATVLIASSMTLLMGLYARLPFAVAPGNGAERVLRCYRRCPESRAVADGTGHRLLVRSALPDRLDDGAARTHRARHSALASRGIGRRDRLAADVHRTAMLASS